jgi:pyrroloquinoline quinone biosynthesis protein A
MWTKPAYEDLRIGFEVTMYFANRRATNSQPPGWLFAFCSGGCHADSNSGFRGRGRFSPVEL